MLAITCLNQFVTLDTPNSSPLVPLLEKRGFAVGKFHQEHDAMLHFKVRKNGPSYDLLLDDKPLCQKQTAEFLCEFIIARIHRVLPDHCPSLTLLKGESVQTPGGGALILVGPDFSGKSTLAAHLIQSGARPGSRHLVVVNESGQVLPYPEKTDSDEGLPVMGIYLLSYRPSSPWSTRTLTSGQTVLQLLSALTGTGQAAAKALPRLTAMAKSASVRLQGERGDAAHAVVHVSNSEAWSTP